MFSRTFKLLISINLLSAQAAGAIVLLCVPSARANDRILQLAEPFYEIFFDGPLQSQGTRSVVGASIVGLRLAGPAHPFEPQAIRVLLGDDLPKPDVLCAKFLSRDGRYFAHGQYKLAGVSDPAPLLDFHTRYHQQLTGYVTTDFAMLAVAGKSCYDLEGSQLFVVFNGDETNARQLIVQLSAGDARVHAQLWRDDVAVGSAVLCDRPASGPTVGYTAECALPLPTPFHAGRYQLSIGETGSAGEVEVKVYSVVLTTVGKEGPK